MVHLYYELFSQGMKFRVAQKGILGLWLIRSHAHYEFALQESKFRVA
jgi:hypothetical protein